MNRDSASVRSSWPPCDPLIRVTDDELALIMVLTVAPSIANVGRTERPRVGDRKQDDVFLSAFFIGEIKLPSGSSTNSRGRWRRGRRPSVAPRRPSSVLAVEYAEPSGHDTGF